MLHFSVPLFDESDDVSFPEAEIIRQLRSQDPEMQSDPEMSIKNHLCKTCLKPRIATLFKSGFMWRKNQHVLTSEGSRFPSVSRRGLY
jgi:hypothetical protein